MVNEEGEDSVGSFGTISDGIMKNTKEIGTGCPVEMLQKVFLLGTVLIIRKVLDN